MSRIFWLLFVILDNLCTFSLCPLDCDAPLPCCPLNQFQLKRQITDTISDLHSSIAFGTHISSSSTSSICTCRISFLNLSASSSSSFSASSCPSCTSLVSSTAVPSPTPPYPSFSSFSTSSGSSNLPSPFFA